MGLKETRQDHFINWGTALLNKDWDSSDTCSRLLLHTLTEGTERRKYLEKYINFVNATAQKESLLLQTIIANQKNPFQKEQLKTKKIELDEWRAEQLHNKFLQVFIKEGFIEKEK